MRNEKSPPIFPPIIAASIILAILAIGFVHKYWITDMLAHLRVHLIAVLMTLLLFQLISRRSWRCILMLAGAVGIGAVTLSFTTPSKPSPDRPVYKALHLNLHQFNTRTDAVIDLLDAVAPDFVSFSEYTGHWDETLANHLAKRFPYRLIEPRRDLGGLVLLSRHPFESSHSVPVRGTPRPILQARVRLPEGSLTLLVLHAESPVNAMRFESRNLTLNRAAALALVSDSDAVIALGDFNCTPWSRNFNILTQDGRLQRPVSPWRIHATWPASLRAAGIPIDHILLSPELTPVSHRVLSHVGSDHLPVVCEFVFSDQ